MIDPDRQESAVMSISDDNGRGRRGRRPGWYAWRALILVVIPIGLIILAVAGSLATYRAVQAAEGHGTKGYFVDVRNGVGEFRLSDGQITRPRVTFADPPPSLRPGAVIPALDTGDVTYVFPRHGSRHWESNAGLLAFVIVAMGAWLLFAPLRERNRRRVRRVFKRRATGPRGVQTTVASAAADPMWVKSSVGLLNGDISTRRVNTALQPAADKKAYPLLIVVGIPLTDTDRATYVVSGESDRLAVLIDKVTSLVAGHGVLAATVADSGAWLFLIYTGSTEWLPDFETALRSEVTDHSAGFSARRDPRWQAYRELWRVAPRTLRARERIVLVTLVPVCAVAAVRYGPVWFAVTFVSIEAWAALIAFRPRSKLIASQLAHQTISAVVLAGILWSVLFPLGAMVVHPTSPWVCAGGAAVLAIAIIAALWPAQRKYLAKMRASGA
jgi:hypothetical protein